MFSRMSPRTPLLSAEPDGSTRTCKSKSRVTFAKIRSWLPSRANLRTVSVRPWTSRCRAPWPSAQSHLALQSRQTETRWFRKDRPRHPLSTPTSSAVTKMKEVPRNRRRTPRDGIPPVAGTAAGPRPGRRSGHSRSPPGSRAPGPHRSKTPAVPRYPVGSGMTLTSWFFNKLKIAAEEFSF